MNLTSFEKGQIKGLALGRLALKENNYELALDLLETKFGPLSGTVRERLKTLSAEELAQLAKQVLKVGSLRELGLEG